MATITPGNYTGDTLATALEDAMIALQAGISVSYDNTTFKFTFVFIGPVPFTITSDVTNALSTLFPVLGFAATQTGSLTYTSDEIANLGVPRYIQIKSALLSDNKHISNMINGTFEETIYTVFPDANFGCTLIKQDFIHEIVYKNTFTVTSIDLRLEDENNVALDLNGVPWLITFDFRVL